MDMADRLVQDGYKELGYEYVNIDVRYCSTAHMLLSYTYTYSETSDKGHLCMDTF